MSALRGLRVLDLSRVLAGPWASQTLADLGANVIKIERPEGGDDTRGWGPPWLERNERNEAGESGKGEEAGEREEGEEAEPGESAYFLCSNRGKRSIRIDIRSGDGQRRLKEIAKSADVLIENFKVGGAARFGLDYPSLSRENPGLIYCSITGFGQTGPLAERPGYDFLVQAMGGLMSVTGAPDGQAGGGPQKVGVALTDIMTGLYANVGILAALAERERSGLGQQLDLALLDVTAATLANQASNYLVGGITPQRLGNAHPNIVPYQSFRAKDREFIVAVGNDAQFARLAALLGQAAWADDPRFAKNAERVAHRESLIPMLAACFMQHDAAHWLRELETAGIPAGPINTIAEALNEPQLAAREMIVTLPHPDNEDLNVVGSPIKLSRTPVSYRRPPPRLGEHDGDLMLDPWGDA
ncbi:CaiB/BaiF CoA transferase family protein [Congregibacter litoralis]|uniref:Putative acyl-CoA transferase/carnitine dehydratase n=1 Tax=Congregibacter litoralis KT71 TaxID=314285 RepID=A4ABL1_9GAMM|nr:CoA transferase [Congregibacter litoralis]EAQ96524.1 putative acyl-CoA transferase/carnitine dehydratase [Congregibacter litoralis KT71]